MKRITMATRSIIMWAAAGLLGASAPGARTVPRLPPPVGLARQRQRAVQHPSRRGDGRRRQRLRRGPEQQPHPEVHRHGHLPHQVGLVRQRQRAVQPSHRRGDGRRRQRLRRGHCQPPHPEVHQHRHLPHPVGLARQRQRAVQLSHRRGDGRRRQRLRRGSAATTASRSSPAPAPTSPSGARPAAATGSSPIPAAWRRTPPATSTSRTTTTTASRSSPAPAPTSPSGARPAAATGSSTSPYGVATDAAGNVYVADAGNHRIQKFTGTGTYLTQWGSPGSGNGQFNSPDRSGDGRRRQRLRRGHRQPPHPEVRALPWSMHDHLPAWRRPAE